jgi:hypothetical protein
MNIHFDIKNLHSARDYLLSNSLTNGNKGICDLPSELIYHVMKFLPDEKDLNAFSMCCRDFFLISLDRKLRPDLDNKLFRLDVTRDTLQSIIDLFANFLLSRRSIHIPLRHVLQRELLKKTQEIITVNLNQCYRSKSPDSSIKSIVRKIKKYNNLKGVKKSVISDDEIYYLSDLTNLENIEGVIILNDNFSYLPKFLFNLKRIYLACGMATDSESHRDSHAPFKKFQEQMDILKKMQNLEMLDLFFPDAYNNSELEKLCALKNLKKLTLLMRNYSRVDSFADFKSLESLRIQGGEITNEGLRQISQLEGLKRLHLINCKMTDQGLKYLANLHQLQSLDLVDCQNKDIFKLVHELPNLESMDLSFSKISEDELAQIDPKVKIIICKDTKKTLRQSTIVLLDKVSGAFLKLYPTQIDYGGRDEFWGPA